VLTNKGKYGLKAMVHLAGLEPGALAQVKDSTGSSRVDLIRSPGRRRMPAVCAKRTSQLRQGMRQMAESGPTELPSEQPESAGDRSFVVGRDRLISVQLRHALGDSEQPLDFQLQREVH
jgi:hypothetical protein